MKETKELTIGSYPNTIESLRKNLACAYGDSDKKIRIVSGMIRSDYAQPTKWGWKEDATHTPNGIASVEGISTGAVRITYNFTAKKVHSFIITPHYSAIDKGFCEAGAAVGLNSADVILKRRTRISGRVTYPNNLTLYGVPTIIFNAVDAPYNIQTGVNDVLNIAIDGGSNQAITLAAGEAVSASDLANDISGKLTGAAANAIGNRLSIATTSIGNGSSIAIIAGTANATLGFTAGTTYNKSFVNPVASAGAGADCVITTQTGSNIGTIFDTNAIPAVYPYQGGYSPHIHLFNASSFTVKFFDATNTEVTTPDINCKFLFERECEKTIHSLFDTVPSGLTWWFMGVFEVE